ncbi:hypothetical protein ACFEMC_13155 [Kineococcus sp. DHX-1]|uniref:hypothetical protein n=1 Tax=Kineococcus sp. DHX-1 TaxID=3349638 RepID=UPI0036D3DEF8
MTHTAQHAAQDALARLTAALDDLLTLPLGTFDRDDIDHAVRAAYALGNRLDAAKLHLLRAALNHTTDGTVTDLLATHPVNLSRTLARKDVAAARHTDPDAHWDGKIGGLDGDRGSLARTGHQLAAGNTTLHHIHGAVRALQSIPTPLRRGTVDMEVQMDSGETAWTTRRRADLIDGHFATVTGTQPLGTANQLSEELLTRLDPNASTAATATSTRTPPADVPSPSPAGTACCA